MYLADCLGWDRACIFITTHQVRHKSELLLDLVQIGLPLRGEYTGIAQHNLQVDQVLHEAVLRFKTICIMIIANAMIIVISPMMIMIGSMIYVSWCEWWAGWMRQAAKEQQQQQSWCRGCSLSQRSFSLIVFTYPWFTELNHLPIFNKNSNHDVEDAFRPKGRPLSSSSLIKKNISDPRFTELNH